MLRIVLPYGTLLLVLAVAFFHSQAIKPVTEATRAFNKRIGNPAMMRLAGRRYWFAGVIRHKGRRSGREYATPVWAVPTTDGFLVSLPFGEGVDWLKNVLAVGRATIESRGETWTVVEPEVVDRETVQSVLPWRATTVRSGRDQAVPEGQKSLGACLGYGRRRRYMATRPKTPG